jgi:hypothetical protein
MQRVLSVPEVLVLGGMEPLKHQGLLEHDYQRDALAPLERKLNGPEHSSLVYQQTDSMTSPCTDSMTQPTKPTPPNISDEIHTRQAGGARGRRRRPAAI